MTQEINRVIVPLDAASETGTAIDTAARLAARWRVPLHGVFIEDEELIGLASLPFARQVTLGAGVEPLTRDRVEDHFRAFAERARRELAAAAERYDVEWSFEAVRGPLAPDMLGGEHDFVVAGVASRPIGDHFRIASRCWSWMAIVARPFLLASREWQTGGSVFTLLRRCDPKSARALDIAAQIEGDDQRYEDACNADRYFYRPSRLPEKVVLDAEKDFDVVILGVPPACLPYVCGDLIRDGAAAAEQAGSPAPTRRDVIRQ